jgi:dihydrofolate reductase
MSPIVYHVATSVDGFIASPDGSWSAFPTVGDHIADYFASLSDYGTVLMGRRTYEVGLAHGVTNPYPTLRSIVVSRVLTTPPDPAIEVIGDDVVARIAELRRTADRPIYLCGGGQLAATLFGAGLIDALIVKQAPLLLGGGVALFGAAIPPTRLTLRDARMYPNGTVVSRYAVAERIGEAA